MKELIPVLIPETVFSSQGLQIPRELERTLFVLKNGDVLIHAADSVLPDPFVKSAAFDGAAFIVDDETFIKASWLSEQIPENKQVFDELCLKAVQAAEALSESANEVSITNKIQA